MIKLKQFNFTIVELLVVFSVFIILASLLQPSLRKLLSSSKHIQCENNLKAVYSGILLYTDDYDGTCPGPSWDGQTARIHSKVESIGEFIYPYIGSSTAENGDRYVPNMVCPANAESDLDGAVYNRVNFKAKHTSGFGRPFGRPVFRGNASKAPKMILEIPSPTKTIALEEADYNNYPYQGKGRMSANPMHFGVYRNTLYFDGQITAVAWP